MFARLNVNDRRDTRNRVPTVLIIWTNREPYPDVSEYHT